MAETSVTLAGNLTDDPQLRHTSAGIARAMFRLAVTGRVRDGEQWRDAEASFFTVVVWREQAEHVAESLSKGAGSWWWAGWSSGRGRPVTARAARWWRSWPRSWGRAAGGRRRRRPGRRGPQASNGHEPSIGLHGGAGRWSSGPELLLAFRSRHLHAFGLL
jgi:hypothetical protein